MQNLFYYCFFTFQLIHLLTRKQLNIFILAYQFWVISFYFEIAMILHESMSINSILVHSESWNRLMCEQLNDLESVNIKQAQHSSAGLNPLII